MENLVACGSMTPWYWRRVELFDGLAQKARGELLARAEVLEIKKGRHIFRARDSATHAYLIQTGMAKMYHLAREGQVTVFWFAFPGDIMGPGVFNGSDHHDIHAQAVANSTLMVVKRSDVDELMLTFPAFAMNLVRLHAARLRLVREMLVDLHCLRSEVRLARLLLRLAQNWGQFAPRGVSLPMRIPHQELANMIGACRQTVNSSLRKFERDGLVAMIGGTMTLLNPDQLILAAGLLSDSPA
jgi:CRP/FNR family transcriptional regulator, cyclic AMP receptor protein